MNVLARNFGCVKSVIGNVLFKNGGLVAATRTASFKSELKIQWIRPKKIPSYMPEKSGDGGLELNVKSNDFAMNVDKSKEIQDADEIVKRMFTLQFMPRAHTRRVIHAKTVALVKRHATDRGSMESIIAAMTTEILNLQECLRERKKNPRMKIFLKELVDKRKKFLGKLRRWDYKRFEWLLEKLNLVYKPNTLAPNKVTRKKSMKLITKHHCNKIKAEKMRAYERELAAQATSFFAEKADKLEFIRNEEIACGQEPTVTEEEVTAARDVAEKYKKRVYKRSIRNNSQ